VLRITRAGRHAKTYAQRRSGFIVDEPEPCGEIDLTVPDVMYRLASVRLQEFLAMGRILLSTAEGGSSLRRRSVGMFDEDEDQLADDVRVIQAEVRWAAWTSGSDSAPSEAAAVGCAAAFAEKRG
jgi:hypothetical protein